MPKPDEAAKSWEAKAKFMRDHHALAAEWDDVGDLRKLQLAPLPPVRPAAPATPPAPPGPKGIAARLMKQHEIQFAHSRVRPPLNLPSSAESDVPRAVSAKQGTPRGSSKKAQKRAS